MSLILEALKKSERQRRLGESPSLGSPIMVVRRRRSVLPVLVVLIAIGLAALWWMRRERATPDVDTSVATKSQTANEPLPSPGPAVAAAPVPRATPAQSEQKKPAAPVLAADQHATQAEKLRSGELVAAHPQAGASATIKESEPVPAADPAAIAAAMADAKKPDTIAQRKQSVEKAPTEKLPETETETRTAPAVPTAPAAPTGPVLKLMWELPLTTRRSLPEIKLSMHVFADEPKQRFVIINGERRVQGDEFDELKLIEIRSDGVVFEHEGVRFLYPRGGR